jgi:hypothetical protein
MAHTLAAQALPNQRDLDPGALARRLHELIFEKNMEGMEEHLVRTLDLRTLVALERLNGKCFVHNRYHCLI